ncbi:MAG: 4-hydroxythreonine-4-phosphate dehydrogenase PdxA [Verrucomicrobiota bacterium]
METTVQKPKIAITMGDPAGVGPEVCLFALTHPDVTDLCIPLVFGDGAILKKVAAEAGLEPPNHVIPHQEWKDSHEVFETPAVIDLEALSVDEVMPGEVSEETGRAGYRYLQAAIDAVQQGQAHGITTGPLHKGALQLAGINVPGHTELLAEATKTDRYCMLLTSEPISCSFVTFHVGFTEVTKGITEERILEVVELTGEAMRILRGTAPKLALCGLNPHAGENGLLGGGEEERILLPALARAKEAGWDIEGPLPPDTAFLPAKRAQVDAYICLYHDQGHIPVKALAFDEAVNCTLGLPIVRTSVDHGTALDIAWKGVANPSSLIEAVKVAVKLIDQRESQTTTS